MAGPEGHPVPRPRRTEIRVHASRLTLFRRGRWRRWVGAAADRLEDLIRLVAEEG